MFCRKRVPIPGVHRPRSHNCDWFRNPQTLNELKLNCPDEDHPRARACRMGFNLPSAWHDIPRCVQRSWKTQRRKQYRG